MKFLFFFIFRSVDKDESDLDFYGEFEEETRAGGEGRGGGEGKKIHLR